MPTKNPRINLTINAEEASVLNDLAKKQKKSVSGLVYELVIEALEKREDLALSEIAKLRDKPKSKRISHKDAWK